MDDLDDLLNYPTGEVNLDDLVARLDLDAENAEKAPEKLRNAGQETGIGHDQRLVTRTTGRRAYDLRNVPNAVRLVRPLPEESRGASEREHIDHWIDAHSDPNEDPR